MKKISFLIILLFSTAVIFTRCVKDRITGVSASITFLGQVRNLYKGQPVMIKSEDLQEATSITGVVISDPEGGNAPEGLVIIQATRGAMTRGIALNLGADAANYYRGDVLLVNVNGKTLDRMNGILQISGLTAADIEVKEVNQYPAPALVTGTMTAITNNMAIYESTLVQVISAVADAADASKPFEGNRLITDWANGVNFYTRPTAEFASMLIPGMGNYTGIALFHSVNNEIKPTIWIRNALDIEELDLEPRFPGELYRNFPEGWEDETMLPHLTAANPNGVDKYPSGEWLFPRMNRNGGGTIGRRPPIPPATAARGLLIQANFTVSLEMNFNLPYGASKLSFYVGPATAADNNTGEFSVSYSQDSGETWTELDRFSGIPFRRDLDHPLNHKEYELDIRGPVRFRFTQHSEGLGTGSRWTIDDIGVYQN
ncbi:MAG: DUF5689 domain-containing protein [Niabella sp.]